MESTSVFPEQRSKSVDSDQVFFERCERVLANFEKILGRTPVQEVPSLFGGARIFAKLEGRNPLGSIKDRTVYAMLHDLIIRRRVRPIRILEYTGGSLGRSLSFLCREMSIPCTIVLSEMTNPKIVSDIRGFGASIVSVDRKLGFLGVMDEACRLSAQNPHWSFLFQHCNQANPEYHSKVTAKEILRDAKSRSFSAFFAAVGTGGTLTGIYESLHIKHPELEICAVLPAEMPLGTQNPPNDLSKFAGSGGLGYGLLQPFLVPYSRVVAKQVLVSFEDSIKYQEVFKEQMGFEIGSSSAAVWKAASEAAAQRNPGENLLAIFAS
jgi:cysteine synthase A